MASVSLDGDAGLQALEAHISGLYGGKLVPEEEVKKICDKAKEILTKEQNVVSLKAPITIVRLRPPSAENHLSHGGRDGRQLRAPPQCCPIG